MNAPIRLTNVVAGAELSTRLDLPKLTHFLSVNLPQYKSIKHRLVHPQTLAIVLKYKNVGLWHRRQHRVTALVYPSGQLTVCGARSVEEALEEAKKMVEVCARFAHLTTIPPVRIKTITAMTSFPRGTHSPRLEQVKAQWSRFASLEPEIFNGLVLHFSGSVKLILFHSFRCIIAGARSVVEAESAAAELARVLISGSDV